MEHLKSAKNKALSNHPLPPKQTLSNNFPLSISEISIQALKSPEPLQSTNSKFSHTFMPQKKNSLTDFTIMHMDTYSPEQMSSPSRYEDSYEIIPDEEYMATASVFNDVDGSQRKEYVYVHQEEYGVGSGNRVEQVQWGTGNLLSDQVTQNYGGNGTGNGKEMGRNAGKFKPSSLFTIVEKVSKEKGNKDDGNGSVNYGRSKGNQGVLEPKKTTVNLMDLIKSYTNNPNLERKIKMNKTSFLTNNPRSAHDKENYSDGQNSETVKNGLRQKGSAKSSVERKQCKENQQLPWVKKENEYLSAKSSKSASKSVKKPLLANSRRSRSKSGEKLDTKLLNQSFQDNIVTLASQMRSLSSNKRRSGSSVFNSESSLVLGSDGVNNSSVMSREQDQIISTLNETMQKLLKKTEINNQELERLKQIKESETQKIQTNQAKLNDLLSQHEAMTAENLYNQDFLAQQSENLLLKGPFQYCVRKDSRSSSYSKQSVQGTEDKNLDKVLKIKMEELNQVRSLLSNFQSGNSTVKPEERIKVASGAQKNSKGLVPAQPANRDSSFIRMSYRKMHDSDSGSASSSITSLGR